MRAQEGMPRRCISTHSKIHAMSYRIYRLYRTKLHKVLLDLDSAPAPSTVITSCRTDRRIPLGHARNRRTPRRRRSRNPRCLASRCVRNPAYRSPRFPRFRATHGRIPSARHHNPHSRSARKPAPRRTGPHDLHPTSSRRVPRRRSRPSDPSRSASAWAACTPPVAGCTRWAGTARSLPPLG